MRARVDFSLSESRRIALASQGLAGPRSTQKTRLSLLRTIAKIHVLQIDAVNVLARAHYVPLFSRHGAYSVKHLDESTYGKDSSRSLPSLPSLFEYWGHQASILPVTLQPLFRWRMSRAAELRDTYVGLARFVRERRKYVDSVLEELRARGPLRASELTQSTPRDKAGGGWWGWSDAKRALEWLFWAGFVTTKTRQNFERVYDLTERVLPAAIMALPTPPVADAHRELVRLSSRAMGIATDDDLADYFRLRLRDVRPRIAELVEEGALSEVRIEGVGKPAYLAAGATLPRQATGRALLSPFDPMIWYRARTHRLFDFFYRIEIYTPEHLRKHGYYVLPFLNGERLSARVDLKAARAEGALLVQAAHLEPGAEPKATADALAGELREAAAWLGLDRVVVAKKGKLAGALARALK